MPYEVLKERLRDVRFRALQYAEYLCFSQTLLSQGQISAITQAQWIDLVDEIEKHIKDNENPNLKIFSLDAYKPLGLFFDTVITNGEIRLAAPRE